ncbi:MAG: tyrosine-type recombinase/integrase [Candidatus Hadarchaeota archaeon]
MNETASDVESFEERFEPWVQRAINGLPDGRRTVLLEFLQEMSDAGASSSTLKVYVSAAQSFNGGSKPFKQLSEEDLRQWCREMDQKYAPWTARQRKARAVKFLRWVHTGRLDGNKKPKCVEWIRNPPVKHVLGKEILTKEEVKRMVDSVGSQRDRALLFALYESGARASEILGMRIKDCEFDRYGAVLRIGRGPNAKTGERRVRLFEAVPDMQLWLSMHPKKEDPEAPLWIGKTSSRGNAIKGPWLIRLVKQAAKNAGITKPLSPHTFRHSRATHLALVLKESGMREFFGWSRSSTMPAVYVHLSGRDVDQTLFEHYGIKPREEPAEDPLKKLVCPRCRTENSVSAKFCWRCWSALDKSDELTDKAIAALIKRAPELFRQILKEEGLDREIAEVASRGG